MSESLNNLEEDRQGRAYAGSAALFAPMTEPILDTVDPQKVRVFLKAWDHFRNGSRSKVKRGAFVVGYADEELCRPHTTEELGVYGNTENFRPVEKVQDLTDDDV